MSNCLQPHGLQHARLPRPSPSPGVCPSLCPLNRWRHLTILSSVTLFCFQPFPASGYFPMSWLFISGGQSIPASASAAILLLSIQGWFPLGLTGLISLLSKGLSRVFSSPRVQKHQFFSTLQVLKKDKNHTSHISVQLGFCFCQLEALGRWIKGWSHLLCFCQ